MIEDQPVSTQSPSEKLAVLIVNALVEKNLLTRADTGKIAEKLASGKMTQEDWRLSIEKLLESQGDCNG